MTKRVGFLAVRAFLKLFVLYIGWCWKNQEQHFKTIFLQDLFSKVGIVKKKGKIYWRVTEKPTNVIVKDFFFEQDARALVRFQNKHRVWEPNGGIPHFLCDIQK